MNGNTHIMSIKEYRTIRDDQISTNEQIRKRIEYLESFCRCIIRVELEKLRQPLRL